MLLCYASDQPVDKSGVPSEEVSDTGTSFHSVITDEKPAIEQLPKASDEESKICSENLSDLKANDDGTSQFRYFPMFSLFYHSLVVKFSSRLN